ncbi:zinc finger domain-containing protein [Streptomyces abikoensis]|uniref:DNA-binding phage zinc finger domain-containing protein n=1 Tax=Streptomyces abikoensis TaxID=97398 RepID=A0ABW7TF18_9ACTN
MTGQLLHPEHAIRCPWCHAPPGERCTGQRGKRISIPSHDARINAWQNTRPSSNEAPQP